MGHPPGRPAEILSAGAATMDIRLFPKTVTRLVQYFELLKIWNSKMNLVGDAPDDKLIEQHFLDSLSVLTVLEQRTEDRGQRTEGLGTLSLLDVGSGAGFPGLVIKIVRPELSVTLVEPRRKRVSFLRHVIRELKLSGIEVLPVRVEDLEPEALFPFITSRAFTGLSELLGMAGPLSPKGGLVIGMKGPKGLVELRDWQTQSAAVSSFQLLETKRLFLPFSRAERILLVFERKAGL